MDYWKITDDKTNLNDGKSFTSYRLAFASVKAQVCPSFKTMSLETFSFEKSAEHLL